MRISPLLSVHFVDDGVLRFQLVHTVGKRGVVLVGIQQIHHNIAVDLRKGVLNTGWQVKFYRSGCSVCRGAAERTGTTGELIRYSSGMFSMSPS